MIAYIVRPQILRWRIPALSADGYLFVTTMFLISMNVLLVCTLATAITKIYLKPIVELWLAADSESAEEEKKTE